MPDIESELCIKHVNMIAELDKKLADDQEFACCSCERLLKRKNVTAFYIAVHPNSRTCTFYILIHNSYSEVIQ